MTAVATAKYYAGIGSRQTPRVILMFMQKLGALLAIEGWTLRSGGADGADKAFEEGCDLYTGPKQIYKPGHHTDSRTSQTARQFVNQLHPNPPALTPYAYMCHERNMYIVLGEDLQSPASFLVCWTLGGMLNGGTAMGIRAAINKDVTGIAKPIPVYNLGTPILHKKIVDGLEARLFLESIKGSISK